METPSVTMPDGTHRHKIARDDFITHYSHSILTLYDSFKAAATRDPGHLFLGTRNSSGKYEWQTYGEVAERVSNLASGLIKYTNIHAKANVGIYAKNRAEWVIAEQACFGRNWVVVPLYDTLGRDSIEYICKQCEIKLVFTTSDKTEKLTGLIENIVLMDDKEETTFTTMTELEELGKTKTAPDEPSTGSDLFTICYTSGVTGTPKGAMIPHSALLSTISSALAMNGQNPLHPLPQGQENYFCELGPEDVYLSYLPLAHIFERLIIHFLIACGACAGFYSGDVFKLPEDAQELNPTGIIVVPRICNRIYDKVMSMISQSNWFTRIIFKYAYESKRAALRVHGVFTHWFWDRLVFAKIRTRLGTRISKIMSGSAPLSPDVLEFMRIVFGCPVYEGYGQTETCGGSFSVSHGDWALAGHVGVPLASCEAKLVDIPDMNYLTTDSQPRGEICIRGPSCFIGYYKDPVRTAETIDPEGWVHTGDVGTFDSFGRLTIIDRKKNMFKLAQGEYIAPERVENILLKSALISQVFVYGHSLETCTLAIIVPLNPTTQDLNTLLTKAVESFGKHGSKELSSLELPRAIYIESTPFSVENGLLTPTMKVKRQAMEQKYAQVFKNMYASVREQQPGPNDSSTTTIYPSSVV